MNTININVDSGYRTQGGWDVTIQLIIRRQIQVGKLCQLSQIGWHRTGQLIINQTQINRMYQIPECTVVVTGGSYCLVACRKLEEGIVLYTMLMQEVTSRKTLLM